ncbi:GntR family transcriptional regulator (plasmid) [Neorhizobium galegae]|nr:GntR family transcriptional regulator [Neorhizobium galegae]
MSWDKGKQVLDSLTGRTIQALKAHIGDGRFESGAKLGSLAELSDRFGVSRTVIREAVSALRSDGIVESRHGVGVFVRNRPGPDIEDSNSLDANITLAPWLV